LRPKETLIQQIKREYAGRDMLDPQREERERSESLGIWARIASKYGGLTPREEATLNI
jgi:hypothetical protein